MKEVVNLVGRSVVLDGEIDENNCGVDDFEDVVNSVGTSVVLEAVVIDGDIDENNCVDDFEEAVSLVESTVVLNGDIDENNSVDDFEEAVNLVEKNVEDKEGAYVDIFGRRVGDNAI